MLRQSRIAAASPQLGGGRASEDERASVLAPLGEHHEQQFMSLSAQISSTMRQISEEDRMSFLPPPASQMKRKTAQRSSWKKQLKFRSFLGKRASKIRALKIVHTRDAAPKVDGVDAEVVLEEAPKQDESRVSTMTFGITFDPPDLNLQQPDLNLQQPDKSEEAEPSGDSEYSDGVADSDDDDDDELDSQNDPFHLEDRLSATEIISTEIIAQLKELRMNGGPMATYRERNMSMSRMSESSSDESRSCSPLPFIDEVDSLSERDDDDNNNDNNNNNTISPDESPKGSNSNHISWNWAEPPQPLALAPAPVPRTTMTLTAPAPATAVSMRRPPSSVCPKQPYPTKPLPPPPPAVAALRANVVMMRRPSRPDNPWSWKLPAPDPGAPKLNTVMVRRPSRMENPWTWKPSSSGRSDLSRPSTRSSDDAFSKASSSRKGSRSDGHFSNASSRRGSRPEDQQAYSEQVRNFPRRPSRPDDPWLRPSVPASPLSREAQPVRDPVQAWRPPRPEDALRSHPVDVTNSHPVITANSHPVASYRPQPPAAPTPLPLTALNSHPVKLPQHAVPDTVHVRQDSVSDGMCRMCHIGVAESWGICQKCDEDTSPHSQSFPSQQVDKSFTTQGKDNRPPLLLVDNAAPYRRHNLTGSLSSDPEANEMTPPISPKSCRVLPAAPAASTAHTVVIAPPISKTVNPMPTPDVLAKYQYGVSTVGGVVQRRPLSNDEWADYYFDQNSVEKMRDRTDSVVSREAQGYMIREVGLEEYDGFWGSPTCPGPGWI
ncbi:hypothetical protein EDB81DRAFT_265330 [Dactylonectria macrodidyma]|uniref:Uncharacterized protein n=1 Tax=Dactylonectria macrodidyma TaxID=307937 RepID=A0A9P9FME3_9HYPO|nr:hypothetical protein EDB81DRAFT_265330 [Dactylonectria macrodidyma]